MTWYKDMIWHVDTHSIYTLLFDAQLFIEKLSLTWDGLIDKKTYFLVNEHGWLKNGPCQPAMWGYCRGRSFTRTHPIANPWYILTKPIHADDLLNILYKTVAKKNRRELSTCLFTSTCIPPCSNSDKWKYIGRDAQKIVYWFTLLCRKFVKKWDFCVISRASTVWFPATTNTHRYNKTNIYKELL